MTVLVSHSTWRCYCSTILRQKRDPGQVFQNKHSESVSIHDFC